MFVANTVVANCYVNKHHHIYRSNAATTALHLKDQNKCKDRHNSTHKVK